ncbi:hypothetical protein [Parvularcula dongshanensis]|uniref:SPOR domain-containing protein n=1 Tax=Parvularcula dongshanensis TaxID=1173995 RepID=A0A840I4H9_9PROT|nr:hypothetical protein [Parvularcula dongshanensis]MBB4659173.1 hypothetical protein [Parvularcula dongshanensis]
MRHALPIRNPVRLLPVVCLLGACASGTAEPVVTAKAPSAAARTLRSTGYAAPEIESGTVYRSVAYRAEKVEPAPLRQPAAWTAPSRGPLPDLDEIVIRREAPTPVRYAAAEAEAGQTFTGETRSVMDDVVRPEGADEPVAEPEVLASLAPSAGPEAAALHLASYRAMAQAEEGWQVLTKQFGDVLNGLSPLTMYVDVPGQGEFVRLLAGPLDEGAAQDACAILEDQGTYCAVIPMEGAAMDRL